MSLRGVTVALKSIIRPNLGFLLLTNTVIPARANERCLDQNQGQTEHMVVRCNWNTSPLKCVDEPASGRAVPPVQDLWLFADCKGERFASSKKPDRSDAWEQDVFYRKGEFTEYPEYQTIHGNPFMRWAKSCPLEAIKGEGLMQKHKHFFREFFKRKQ